MHYKYHYFFLCMTCSILLVGCWSKTELNDLAIVAGIAIDKVDDGYLLSLQIINPSELSPETQTSETNITTYSEVGKTLYEAKRKLSEQVPGDIYLAHTRVVIFSEAVAKEGLQNPIDFISRNQEFRTDFYLFVARNSNAAPMLNVLTSIETIPAQSIFDKLKFSELMWAPTKRVTIDELTKILQIKGKNPILTGVYIRGDQEFSGSLENIEHIEPPAIIKVDRLGVFLGDKLVGWLTIDESKGYNYIVNNVKSTVINVPCAEDETDVVAIEITETDTKIKAGMKHDHPTIEVNILVEANVGEVQCELDLNQSGNIKHLEDQIEKKIKEVMDRAIQKAQSEFKSDIFGFGVALHRAHPNAWRTLKDEWDEVFPNIAVTTNVEAHIRHLGTTANPIQAEGGK